MNSTLSNQATIEHLYTYFKAQDLEQIRAIFDDDIEWIQMEGFPGGGRHTGPDAIFQHVFGKLRHQWDNWGAIVEEFLDAGDSVLAMGYYQGTHRETGKAMKAPFAHWYKLKAGKIIRFEQFTDTLVIARAADLA